MKYSLLFSCLATVMLVATGCDSTSPNPAPELTILPLTVGNQWIMKRTREDTTGVPLVSHDGAEITTIDTLRVVRDTTVQGERWFEITSPQGSAFAGFYAQRADGIWKRRLRSSGMAAPSIWYKFPAAEDASYWASVASETERRTGVTFTVRSKETVRQTEGGIFATYHYELTVDSIDAGPDFSLLIEDGPVQTSHYLAPEIGFVDLETGYVGTGHGMGTALTAVNRIDRMTLIAFQPAN